MKSVSNHIARLLMGVVLASTILGGISAAQTPVGTRIDNHATLRYSTEGGGQPDSIASNTVSTVVEGQGALRLQKSVTPSSAVPGDTVIYAIAAGNAGSNLLSGVTVTDTLPGSLSVLGVSHGSSNGNIVRWDIGAFPAGGKDTLLISAIVHRGTAAGAAVVNRCFGGDTSGSTVVASANLVINAAPRLAIEKAVSKATIDEGDTLLYTIRISNSGNTTLTAATVRDTLPATVQYLSASPGAQFSAGSVTYVKDSLVIGERDSIIVRVIVRPQIGGGTAIQNTATATANQTAATHTSVSSVAGIHAALAFIKRASADTAAFGDTVRFTLGFGNTGNVALLNMIITDTLPSGLTYVSGTAGGQFVNGVYSFRRDTLNRGEPDSVAVVTRISDVNNHWHTVINDAGIVSDQTAAQRARASITYRPSQSTPSFTFVKSGPAKALSGDTVAYTISLDNQGPGTLTGVVITDTLDRRMRFISATPNGSYDTLHHRIVWRFPRVDSLGNVSCAATVALSDTLSRSTVLLNRAELASDEITGVRSQVQTLVVPPAVLTISKTASSGQTFTGDTLVYTITVMNISQGRGDSLAVTDALPDELGFVSARPAAEYSGATRTLVWRLDSLAAGEQRQFNVTTIVQNSALRGEHELTNAASVRWTAGINNATLEAHSQSVVQLLAPYLQISKQAVRRIVEVGGFALYTISVTNLSANTTAYNLTIVDDPPLGFSFVPGSSFRDSIQIQDPVLHRKELQWHLADSLTPGATLHLIYRLVVGAGALDGNGVNSARAHALAPGNLPVESPVASDRVEIQAGVFTDRGLVIGKVFYDDNENKYQDDGEEGIKGVELIMEDGTRVTTGDDGKYSLPEVAPGEHVIRLRQETLPPGDELLTGYDEFANIPSSRFVKVPESGIARSDFYVRRGRTRAAEFTQEIAKAGTIRIRRTAAPKHLVFVHDESLAPISIKGTQFEVGKAILRPEAYPTLRAVADYAREFPDQLIAVSGHTDSSPIHTREFPSNKELSEARAGAVREYLVRTEHIDSLRITAIGFGETQPVASNATKSGKSLNRRVEIMISSDKNPFENYFKTVRMEIAVDYDGAVPISHLEVNDHIDTSFHVVAGSALLDRESIPVSVSGQNVQWVIDSIGTSFHKRLTYDVRVFSPRDPSETIHSQTTLNYRVADSACTLDEPCVTTNVVAGTTRSKPLRFVMSGVLFDVGTATLKEEALNSLKGAADVMKTYPHSSASIDGYTDSLRINTTEFPSNVALSHARATAVLRRLIETFGIDSTRLKAAGWGELKPVASNRSEEGRKANRRVEINIDKQEAGVGAPREGSVDSSLSRMQRVESIRGATGYDTTTRVSVGDRLYLKISAASRVARGSSAPLLVDSLPGGLTLVPNSVRLVRGIDSSWTADGALHLRCTPGDSVHTYSITAEVTNDAAGARQIEHHVAFRETLKNGTSFYQRSKPLIIRMLNRGDTGGS